MKLNKHEQNLKDFAERHEGWHTYSYHCKLTRRTVKSMLSKGFIVTNEFNQFKANNYTK